MSSLSALTSKSYSNPEATPTSQNVAPNAVRQEKQTVMETVATADTATVSPARCSLRYAPSVARKLKYRLNLAKVDQCIAVIATEK